MRRYLYIYIYRWHPHQTDECPMLKRHAHIYIVYIAGQRGRNESSSSSFWRRFRSPSVNVLCLLNIIGGKELDPCRFFLSITLPCWRFFFGSTRTNFPEGAVDADRFTNWQRPTAREQGAGRFRPSNLCLELSSGGMLRASVINPSRFFFSSTLSLSIYIYRASGAWASAVCVRCINTRWLVGINELLLPDLSGCRLDEMRLFGHVIFPPVGRLTKRCTRHHIHFGFLKLDKQM